MYSGKKLEDMYRVDHKGCWRFLGSIQYQGYGKIKRGGRNVAAHRYFYEKLVGQIPNGLTLDHLCEVKDCVNPNHLKPATIWENSSRGNCVSAINSRKVFCKRNHPLPKIAERKYGQMRRECMPCIKIRSRKNYLKKKRAYAKQS